MPVVKIEFCDGKFISHNGVEVKSFSEKSVEANGWKCEISESGKFTCSTIYFEDGVKKQIKMVLEGGRVKTKWRQERERPQYKWNKLQKYPAEGIIILPSISAGTNKMPKFFECSVASISNL